MDREPSINPDDRSLPAPGTAKKPYHAPELMEWGALAEITQKVGYRGANDGGRFPYGYKTSF